MARSKAAEGREVTLQEIADSIGNLTHKVDGLTLRVVGLTVRVDGMNEKDSSLTETVEGLTEQVGYLTLEFSGLNGRVNVIGVDVHEMKERMFGIERRLGKVEVRVEDVNDTLLELLEFESEIDEDF
jgi:uncharacterized protein YoxC